jgi:hypothetical protein
MRRGIPACALDNFLLHEKCYREAKGLTKHFKRT